MEKEPYLHTERNETKITEGSLNKKEKTIIDIPLNDEDLEEKILSIKEELQVIQEEQDQIRRSKEEQGLPDAAIPERIVDHVKMYDTLQAHLAILENDRKAKRSTAFSLRRYLKNFLHL